MDDDDVATTTQLFQALLQQLTARAREASAAQEQGRHGHATQRTSAVGGRPLAGAAVGNNADDHEAPRGDDGGSVTPTLPGGGGGHLQLLSLPPFEHEATTSLELVTEMLQRGLSEGSDEFSVQMMEIMRLMEHDDDIGDILERIYERAVADGVPTPPLPQDNNMLPEQNYDRALAAEGLTPLLEWLLEHLDIDGGGGGDGDRGFGGGVPATSEVVAGLEKRKYQRSSAGQDDDDNQCPICLIEYAVDEDLCVMPCKHGFHQECLAGWLARSCLCPICRHALMPSGGAGRAP